MHIHSYQIHNVLNAYLKHLSEGARAGSKSRQATPLNGEKGSLSASGQRQSIIEKISREIVERIIQFGPQNRFKDTLAQQLRQPSRSPAAGRPIRDSKFTYTLIDEDNQRSTHTLAIHNFRPLMEDSHSARQDGGFERQLADALRKDRSGDDCEV